jgi:hypothetical protein
VTDHPITPPPELTEQWYDIIDNSSTSWKQELATRAARWGADQELLACGNYLKQCAQWEEEDVTEFYNYRRPKPPSLKEQALMALEDGNTVPGASLTSNEVDIIRRALEALDD